VVYLSTFAVKQNGSVFKKNILLIPACRPVIKMTASKHRADTQPQSVRNWCKVTCLHLNLH